MLQRSTGGLHDKMVVGLFMVVVVAAIGDCNNGLIVGMYCASM